MLQDDLAGAEIAGLGRTDCLLAHISHAMLVDGRAALWALSKRLLVAEINGLPLSFAGTLAEVELGQVVGVEADHGCKRAPHLAAEAL